jgi:ferritin-like metal-binding protein YciE
MGFFTKDIKTMDDLLIHGLQDIYYAEQRILKSLPKMIEKATNRDLVAGLKGHLEETNKQVERLEKAFEKLGKQPSGTQCPAIDGIIKEADETAGEIEDKWVLDAAIVANAHAVEHYEMCRYGTLIAWAEELGHDEIVRFLNTNLNEEKAANSKLNTWRCARASTKRHRPRPDTDHRRLRSSPSRLFRLDAATSRCVWHNCRSLPRPSK